MKKHAIIPLFIPHAGCPHDCVFCNQKKITAKTDPVSVEDVRRTIDTWLTTLDKVETVEAAFYGGSFTAIPIEEQMAYLSVAKEYKDLGLIDKIHLSTRPDCVGDDILKMLLSYGVDIIELGVQSFDDEVLRFSGRGHDAASVYDAAERIGSFGFTLGIQLMIGLPGDSPEKCIMSAKETVKLSPSIARLYPTIVIEDTALYDMSKTKKYAPLSCEEAVKWTVPMYRILSDSGINMIRVGLKATDVIREDGDISGGTFHPAFRQLVEGEIAREDLESLLADLLSHSSHHMSSAQSKDKKTEFVFAANPVSFSNMIGHRSCNRRYFSEKYPGLDIRYVSSDEIAPGKYTILSSSMAENSKGAW